MNYKHVLPCYCWRQSLVLVSKLTTYPDTVYTTTDLIQQPSKSHTQALLKLYSHNWLEGQHAN